MNVTYDYIIIGGGTAGLVIAKRLSKVSNITIAVVEAGNFYEIMNGNLSVVPYFATSKFSNSKASVD